MKFTSKRILQMLCILLVGIAISAGCSAKEEASSSLPEPQVEVDPSRPGWEQDTRSVTLDWYVHFPWYTGTWGQDVVTQYVTELTGVDVNFIIPAGNPNDKLNTLIASDSLPDIITIGWYEDLAKVLQDPNFAYSLQELAEAYDPYFFEVASNDKLNWYRKEDGASYGYPNASYTLEDYRDYPETIFSNDTFMVRKDIYEAIGSPDMSTVEGFQGALQAAKEQFPEVDGQPIVPLGFLEFGGGPSSLGVYLQNFLAIPNAKDGEVYDRENDPEYIRWLKALRQANEMNLISRDVFSDTRQQIEEKMTQGRYFALFYPYIDAIWPLTTRYKENPDTSYIPIAGPKNSAGSKHELSGPGISGWTVTLISKKNRDPEKTIRLFTFLMSKKGIEVAFLGKQGVTWDVIDGKPAFLPEIDAMRSDNRAEFDKKYGADWMLWMFMDTAYQFREWPIPAPEAYNKHREWTIGKTKARFEFENIDPLGTDDLGASLNKISIKFGEELPQFILAESEKDFDAIFQAYLDYREENQFQEIQAYRTKKYLENKDRLAK